VFQPTNGALRFQRTSPIGSSMGTTIAGLGDLDQDGTQEFALVRTTNGVTRIDCESGTGLFRRWSLPNLPGAIGVGGVAAIGDVDDDGAGDLAVQRFGAASDGWSVISGRILAESQPQGSGCGAVRAAS
jgi:hypothetical protein